MTGAPPHLPVLLHHDVGVVAVSNPEDEGRHAVTRAGSGEQVDGAVVPEGGRGDVRQAGGGPGVDG